MRIIPITKEQEERLNVWYDAVTKRQGTTIAELRRLSKILDKFDQIAVLNTVSDQYVIKEEENSQLILEEDQWEYIRSCANENVNKWLPQRARIIVAAMDYLEQIPEGLPKPEIVYDAR